MRRRGHAAGARRRRMRQSKVELCLQPRGSRPDHRTLALERLDTLLEVQSPLRRLQLMAQAALALGRVRRDEAFVVEL